MKNEDFNLKNVPQPVDEVEITEDDFKFVQTDKKIFDQKFQTKPTTFFKDSLKRFSKNKSSLVATGILGVLLLLSIVVPIVGKTNETHNTKKSHPEIYYLEPKLFKSGTGFWDGTRKYKNIPVDISSDPDGNDKENNWWPDPDIYEKGAILKGTKVFTNETYTDNATTYGKGGYIQFGYYNNIDNKEKYVHLDSYICNKFDLTSNTYVTAFDVYDSERLKASDEITKTLPEGYVDAESALYFIFSKNSKTHEVVVEDYDTKHVLGANGEKVNVTDLVLAYLDENSLDHSFEDDDKFYFEVRVKNAQNHQHSCALIKSIKIDNDSINATYKGLVTAPSFDTGNQAMIRDSESKGYWTGYDPCVRKTYLSRAILASFTYDTYEAKLGYKKIEAFPVTTLEEYKDYGYIDYSWEGEYDSTLGTFVVKEGTWNLTILKPDKVPFDEGGAPKEEDVVLSQFSPEIIDRVSCYVLKYKYDFKLDKMPKFLLGTDKTGRDMLVYVFEGLRTSLVLGIATTAICFIFGLIWGAICGYFGGAIDLAMERFTDILSGVPWIVVMTLVIINMGSTFFTFALALCLTGWIGTAATTRTQFYRFRGREYVLASRTLGASNARLIAKHILPNAMGTIITSAVLMVPSVIFSEATISYLGLGFKNLASLGVILSNNQVELTNHPFLLIFPSVIIALLMISFNLFGNGLRDAVNPSLKGEGE